MISTIVDDHIQLPLFIHCTSGKDRTGVITATILKSFGITDELIVQEYLLSEGVSDPKHIQLAIDGLDDVHQYLSKGLSHKLIQTFSG